MMFRKSVLLATVSLSLLLCTTTFVGASPIVDRRQVSPEKSSFGHAPVQIDAVVAADKKPYGRFEDNKDKSNGDSGPGRGNGNDVPAKPEDPPHHPHKRDGGGPAGQGNDAPLNPPHHPRKRDGDGLPYSPEPRTIVPGYDGDDAPRGRPPSRHHHPPAQDVSSGGKLAKRFAVLDPNDDYQYTLSWWPQLRDRLRKGGSKHKRDILYLPEEAHSVPDSIAKRDVDARQASDHVGSAGSMHKRSIEAVEHVEKRQNDEGLNGGGSSGEHHEPIYHRNDEGFSPITGAKALHKRQVSIHQRAIEHGDDEDIYFRGNDGNSWNKRSLNVERRSSDGDDGDDGDEDGNYDDPHSADWNADADEAVKHRDRPSIRRRDAEEADPLNPVRGDGLQSSGRYRNEDGEDDGWKSDNDRAQELYDSGRRHSGRSSKESSYPDYSEEYHEPEYKPYFPTEPGIEVTEQPPTYVPRHKQNPKLETGESAPTPSYQPLIAPDTAAAAGKPAHPKPDASTQKPAPVTSANFFDVTANVEHPYIYISSTLQGQAQGASYYGSCRCARGPGDDKLGADSTTCLGKYVQIATTTATCTNVDKDVVRCTEADGNDKMEAGDSVWWQQAFCKRCVDAGGVSDPIFQCPDGYSPEGKVDAAKDANPEETGEKKPDPATKPDPARQPQPKK